MSFLVCFHLPAQPLALGLMHFLVVTGTKNPLTLKGRNCNCWPRNHFTFTSIKHCTRNDPSCETSVNWITSPGSCVVALGSEGREDDSVHASRSHGTITHCTALLQGQGQAHHASARFFSVTSSYRFFQEPWYRLTAFPKFAVHHFLSLNIILLLPQAPPEDGECPFAKPAAIKMWQAY